MSTEEIKKIIESLLDKLAVEYEEVSFMEGMPDGTTTFMIKSADSKLLIGGNGAHLTALNHVARQLVKKQLMFEVHEEEEVPSFSIDVNNYRGKRMEELAEMARVSAERAKLFRREVELEPMTSYERMIVHSALAEDPEIVTESHGEDRFRRVVIKYVEKEAIMV